MSVWISNGLAKFGRCRTGVVVNAIFNARNASVAILVQTNAFLRRRLVSGAASFA